MGIEVDKDYQAQDDAYTLARAEEIKLDKPRLEAAQAKAKQMAKKIEEEKKAMEKVAKTSKKASKSKKVGSDTRTALPMQLDRPRVATGGQFNVFKKV